MGTVGSVYFLMLPSMVVFAAVLPHVLRPKLVFLVNLLINLIAAPPFLYFTHPKRVMRTFHSVKSMKAPAPVRWALTQCTHTRAPHSVCVPRFVGVARPWMALRRMLMRRVTPTLSWTR